MISILDLNKFKDLNQRGRYAIASTKFGVKFYFKKAASKGKSSRACHVNQMCNLGPKSSAHEFQPFLNLLVFFTMKNIPIN